MQSILGCTLNTYERKKKKVIYFFFRHHTTPLIFAAREGHVNIVRLLLEHGADVDSADSRGYTVSKNR